MEQGPSENGGTDAEDEKFRQGWRIGFAFGREVGFGEGVEAAKRAFTRILAAMREKK